jgi:hypothetical protein
MDAFLLFSFMRCVTLGHMASEAAGGATLPHHPILIEPPLVCSPPLIVLRFIFKYVGGK